VLFNGRFVERKGIRELMEAIGIVLGEAPAVRFVLAGGHRGAAEHKWNPAPALSSSISRADSFHRLADPGQLTKWYRRADILVVPSWYEPFGMVILEGMLHGVAIAASAVGGPSEILDHERTGLLFPARTQKLLLKQFFGSLAIPLAASESAQPVQERCERSCFGAALLKRCSGSTRS
jgi:glycogen(starch) synthase